MTPSAGSSERPQQRPHYVPFSTFTSTPTRLAGPSAALYSASPKKLISPSTSSSTRSPSNIGAGPSITNPAAARLSHGSPSAYDRFNEVDWIIDLSSRIGNALQSPPQPPTSASPSSSSSHALTRSRSRVRLPRPSRDFLELQRRVQLDHASSTSSAAPEVSIDSNASFSAQDPDGSATQWSQHAQQDFERRRADLHQSRHGVLRHLQHDQADSDVDGPDPETAAGKVVDPAVERSMLAARSLQELMQSGGLQPEGQSQQVADFSNLLTNAEALPTGAAQFGPSSLFEAHRAQDGSLDIESILQQRATMAAVEDHDQAAASTPTSSMLDLSQAASKPVKRPVIEVLEGETSGEHGQPAANVASRPSDSSSYESSSESDGSDSSEDSDSDSNEAADDDTQDVARTSLGAPLNGAQSTAPTPMDQIAIVNGTFQIIPAQPSQSFNLQQSQARPYDDQVEADQDALADYQDGQLHSASDAPGWHDADAATEDSDDEEEDEDDEQEADQDEESDFGSLQRNATYPASQRYHDGFRGVDTRDLLYEGPTGDADEPIVLSDSDDDDAAEEEDDVPSDRGHESEDEDQGAEEDEEDNEDELAEESIDSEGDEQSRSHQVNTRAPAHLDHDLRQHQREGEGFAEEQQEEAAAAGSEQRTGAEQNDADLSQRSDASHSHGVSIEPTQKVAEPDQGSTQSQIIQSVAPRQPNIEAGETNGPVPLDKEGDGMPDSEIEPEELDEDLRWSDIEARQHDDDDGDATADAHDTPQVSSAGAAFRARQGSQAMPGFVSAAQIFADIQAAEAQSKNQGGSTIDASYKVQIDPQLLSEVAGIERVAADASRSADVAAAAPVARSEPSNSQMEADIFDAFTRQDAASDTNSLDGDRQTGDEASPAAAREAERDDKRVTDEASDLVAGTRSLQPEDVLQQDGSAAADDQASQPTRAEEAGAQSSDEDDTRRKSASPALDEDKVQRTEVDPRINGPDNVIATSAEVNEPAGNLANVASPPDDQDEEVLVTTTTVKDTIDRAEDSIEAPTPGLARDESTDVLEADIEDNSEEEAVPVQATIELSNVSALATPADTASSDSGGKGSEAGSVVPSDSNVDVSADEPPSAVTDNVDRSVPHDDAKRHTSAQVQDEDGILSADLADRDTSIERQDGTGGEPARVTPQEDEAVPQIDEQPDVEHSDLILAPASNTDAVQDASQVSLADKDGSQLAEEKAPQEETPAGVDNGRQGDEVESSTVGTTSARPVVVGPTEDKQADAPVSARADLRSPIRVPPSPASSDRRSTSSFTPSANRQGNRHLHGAPKRSFFAQVTEAASGLASNLAAPLRAIPSLLPITERRAEEMLEDTAESQASEMAENDVQGQREEEDHHQSSRPSKSGAPAEHSMITRSHCIWRKLRLNKVEGQPVFIVPGCSINYEQASKESADDLGPTVDNLADDWIAVDPDLIPNDVHHVLSRIVGLQILNEGINVEPDSFAAKLVFSGYDLDVELPSPLDGEFKRELDSRVIDDRTDVQVSDPTAEEEAIEAEAEAKEEIAASAAGKEEIDDDTPQQVLATPTRATRRSTRHRRASSVASTSSQHHSPRHADPKSPNADYLPDDERRRLLKDRHPPASIPRNISIASLEEQAEKEEVGASADNEAEHADAEAPSRMASSSPPPKKRGRPRKSETANGQNPPSTQDDSKVNEDEKELVSEPRPKKRRGRKSAAFSAVDDAKDMQDAAAVEDALDTAPLPSKRARRGGRNSSESVSLGAAKEEANLDAEDSVDQARVGSAGTQMASTNENDKSQQSDIKDESPSASEPQQGGKAKRGGRGGKKRKQKAEEDSTSTTDAAASLAVEKIAKVDEAESVKSQPRRGRRSQGGAQAQTPSPSKTGLRKSPKRKVLKLN